MLFELHGSVKQFCALYGSAIKGFQPFPRQAAMTVKVGNLFVYSRLTG